MVTVLISGTNRGLGLEFVLQYLARGSRVIACCGNPDKAVELQQLTCPALRIVPTVNSWPMTGRKFPRKRLDLVIDR